MVVTVYPSPAVTLGNDTVIGVSQTMTLDAGAGFVSYLWSTGDTTQTIIADSSGIGAGTGTFSVTVTDANGCQGTDAINITFVTNPGISEYNAFDNCKVFPNPATDQLNIVFTETSLPAEIFVFNPIGMKVYEMKCQDNIVINTSGWSKGVYTLMLKNPDSTGFIKVMIR